jgi:hypothetical protein
MDTSLDQGEHCNGRERTRPRQPVTPERARTRRRARQSASLPRRLRPPFDLSVCTEPRHDTRKMIDTLTLAPLPCRRRPRRRRSPRYRQYTVISPSQETSIFCAIKPVVLAVTYRTPLHHRPRLSATVSSSPWSTCPVRLGTSSPL